MDVNKRLKDLVLRETIWTVAEQVHISIELIAHHLRSVIALNASTTYFTSFRVARRTTIGIQIR